jgi:hypothetical protein
LSRLLDVPLDRFYGGSEPTNAIDLREIDGCRGEHGYANSARSAIMRERR